jgi:hypothetical protein
MTPGGRTHLLLRSIRSRDEGVCGDGAKEYCQSRCKSKLAGPEKSVVESRSVSLLDEGKDDDDDDDDDGNDRRGSRKGGTAMSYVMVVVEVEMSDWR